MTPLNYGRIKECGVASAMGIRKCRGGGKSDEGLENGITLISKVLVGPWERHPHQLRARSTKKAAAGAFPPCMIPLVGKYIAAIHFGK